MVMTDRANPDGIALFAETPQGATDPCDGAGGKRRWASLRSRARWTATAAVRRIAGEGGYARLQARWLAHSIRSRPSPEPEVALLPHLVAAGETAVDVGANHGLYAARLAWLVGPAGRVVALEPVPATADLLCRVLTRLGVADVVEVVQAGASDHNGDTLFTIGRRADGSLESATAWAPPPGAPIPASGVRAPLRRLDELLGQVDVAFLKIDAEGAEPAALEGAPRLLARSRPTILLEVSNATLARQGRSRQQLGELLARHGYETFRYNVQGGVLEPAAVAATDGNLLAVHPTRHERVALLLRTDSP